LPPNVIAVLETQYQEFILCRVLLKTEDALLDHLAKSDADLKSVTGVIGSEGHGELHEKQLERLFMLSQSPPIVAMKNRPRQITKSRNLCNPTVRKNDKAGE
jgi:hypothetical protein